MNKLFLILAGTLLGFGIFFLVDFLDDSSKEPEEKFIPDKKLKRELAYLEYALDSLHEFMGNPIYGEWLYHNREVEQNVFRYLDSDPKGPTNERSRIYLQPLGEFDSLETGVLKLTAEYLTIFYNIPVEILEPLSTDLIPDGMRRQHQDYEQVNSEYILDDILVPRLPDNAVSYLAFTNYDLFPNDSYNFVFGQANLGKRVGVYSTARFGNPAESKEAYQLFLSRTLKVAAHELGHMFSITHCVRYKCVMNGSNNMEESDAKPHFLCPEDLMKVCHHLNIDMNERFLDLSKFWQRNGFPENERFCLESISLLKRYAARDGVNRDDF